MPITDAQEIIKSLGELKAETSVSLAALSAKVDGMNRRLDVSNGRIAHNEDAIQQLWRTESEMLVNLRNLQKEQENRTATSNRYRVAMVERLLWLASAIVLAVVARYIGAP